MDASPELDDLLARVAATEARLDALEARPSSDSLAERRGLGGDLWAVTELGRQVAAPGAVMLVGDVVTPDGGRALWQEGRTTSDLLADDWFERAASLASLAHPVRLKIVRLALDGPVTAKELADRDDLGSTGQVYHHLKQLTSAGWLHARAGRHSVPTERVVPLMAVVLGVSR